MIRLRVFLLMFTICCFTSLQSSPSSSRPEGLGACIKSSSPSQLELNEEQVQLITRLSPQFKPTQLNNYSNLTMAREYVSQELDALMLNLQAVLGSSPFRSISHYDLILTFIQLSEGQQQGSDLATAYSQTIIHYIKKYKDIKKVIKALAHFFSAISKEKNQDVLIELSLYTFIDSDLIHFFEEKRITAIENTLKEINSHQTLLEFMMQGSMARDVQVASSPPSIKENGYRTFSIPEQAGRFNDSRFDIVEEVEKYIVRYYLSKYKNHEGLVQFYIDLSKDSDFESTLSGDEQKIFKVFVQQLYEKADVNIATNYENRLRVNIMNMPNQWYSPTPIVHQDGGDQNTIIGAFSHVPTLFWNKETQQIETLEVNHFAVIGNRFDFYGAYRKKDILDGYHLSPLIFGKQGEIRVLLRATGNLRYNLRVN